MKRKERIKNLKLKKRKRRQKKRKNPAVDFLDNVDFIARIPVFSDFPGSIWVQSLNALNAKKTHALSAKSNKDTSIFPIHSNMLYH